MKFGKLIICILFLFGKLSAQIIAITSSYELKLSKSKINTLIYPGNLLTDDKAKSFLRASEEQGNDSDAVSLKTWFTANLERFGINPTEIPQVFIFASRQYRNCISCKNDCTGQCTQDNNSECICISKWESKLIRNTADILLSIIFFSIDTISEEDAMQIVSKTIASNNSETTKN